MGKYEELPLLSGMKADLLQRAAAAFSKRDSAALKEVSNEAIEQAGMVEDPDLVSISLITYALYKFLSKPHFKGEKEWEKFLEKVVSDLESARSCLGEGGGSKCSKILETSVIADISDFDSEFGNYAKDVIGKARLKQASRLYAIGFSLARSAEVTGADRIELARYVGETKIHDRPFTTTRTAAQRYKYFKKLMEGKA
jgi:hypothetical protein